MPTTYAHGRAPQPTSRSASACCACQAARCPDRGADQPLSLAERDRRLDQALDVPDPLGPAAVQATWRTSSRIVRPARARLQDPRFAHSGVVAERRIDRFHRGLELGAVGRRSKHPDVAADRPDRVALESSADAQSVKIEASRSAHVNTSGRLSATIAAASPATIAVRHGGRRRQKSLSEMGQSAGEKGPTVPTWEREGSRRRLVARFGRRRGRLRLTRRGATAASCRAEDRRREKSC